MIKKKTGKSGMSRREYLKTTLAGSAGMLLPTIVPASVLGKNAPSNRIQIGQIGFGRIAKEHDLPDTLRFETARVVAVCDLDKKRKETGKQWIEQKYAEKTGKPKYVDVKMYDDYHDLLANPEIDAVIISTPDHWHAQPAIEAAIARKHIYLQKPTSLTIAEGRQLSDMVHRMGVTFQIGSQQRAQNPWPQFKRACELVRNGRIGRLQSIKIGLPGDPGGDPEPEMPVPAGFDYEKWLGSTPYAYYTEKRVHPQNDFSRPGWLRCEQFGAGMITGWGAHHIDTAHWAMGTEYTGPVEIKAEAKFPASGLWNVHGDFLGEALYANGVKMLVSGAFPNGVRFEGSEGWIFVSRGNVGATATDPAGAQNSEAFSASNPKILQSVIGPDETHLYVNADQHGNWLDCILSGQPTAAPVEVAHRSCSACLLFHKAMKLGRKLYWDPVLERFRNDDEANRLLSRSQRFPYGTDYVLAR
jgi:myo-inositol 2-dehydrogenase / D-chiro-inositol 1-dehydrogenase